jgi:hypothetical protein
LSNTDVPLDSMQFSIDCSRLLLRRFQPFLLCLLYFRKRMISWCALSLS